MHKFYGLNIVAGSLYTKSFTLYNQNKARPLRIWDFFQWSILNLPFSRYDVARFCR